MKTAKVKSTAYVAGVALPANAARAYFGVRAVTGVTITFGSGAAMPLTDGEFLELDVTPINEITLTGSSIVLEG